MLFLFYQVRSQKAKTVALPQAECPNCKTTGQMAMSIFNKYLWFLFPHGPFGKTAIIDCNACGNSIPATDWNATFHQIYRKEKKGIKRPLSHYSLFIIIISMLVLAFSILLFGIIIPGKRSMHNQEQRAADKQNLQQGDIFLGLMSGGIAKFKVAKIEKIEGEDIALIKLSKKMYTQSEGQSLSASDFSTNDFELENIAIEFSALRKYGSVSYHLTSEQYKAQKIHSAFMIYHSKLN
jgi:preprotein translocase subunit YajC